MITNFYYRPQLKVIISTVEDLTERCEDLTEKANKFMDEIFTHTNSFVGFTDLSHSEKSSSIIINYSLFFEEEIEEKKEKKQ
jgi:hypothetical protein